ncbi:MAG: hypothetical protein V5783_11265 [Pontiella sp.]
MKTIVSTPKFALIPRVKLRPYLTGGLGHQTLDEDDENRTFQWNGGRGLLCKFHAKRTLNADWLSYYSPPAKNLRPAV